MTEKLVIQRSPATKNLSFETTKKSKDSSLRLGMTKKVKKS